jgi:hypothetical protein
MFAHKNVLSLALSVFISQTLAQSEIQLDVNSQGTRFSMLIDFASCSSYIRIDQVDRQDSGWEHHLSLQ